MYSLNIPRSRCCMFSPKHKPKTGNLTHSLCNCLRGIHGLDLLFLSLSLSNSHFTCDKYKRGKLFQTLSLCAKKIYLFQLNYRYESRVSQLGSESTQHVIIWCTITLLSQVNVYSDIFPFISFQPCLFDKGCSVYIFMCSYIHSLFY